LPIYAHYRFVQRKLRLSRATDGECEQEYNRLHERYAPRVEAVCLSLKGFYLKLAQVMSTQDQFVPRQYMSVCKKMQDQVPSDYAEADVRRIIARELGRPTEEAFAVFDPLPLGSASIGQVHRARLHDGREVVVKIQHDGAHVPVVLYSSTDERAAYEGIEKKFRVDVAQTIAFCLLAMPQQARDMCDHWRRLTGDDVGGTVARDRAQFRSGIRLRRGRQES
jgi:aarF domain-containing kinase